MCKLVSHFTIGFNGSLYDYIIHVALIAIPHTSLITSFQPPLAVTVWLSYTGGLAHAVQRERENLGQENGSVVAVQCTSIGIQFVVCAGIILCLALSNCFVVFQFISNHMHC